MEVLLKKKTHHQKTSVCRSITVTAQPDCACESNTLERKQERLVVLTYFKMVVVVVAVAQSIFVHQKVLWSIE